MVSINVSFKLNDSSERLVAPARLLGKVPAGTCLIRWLHDQISIKFLDADVAKLNCHWRTGMQLKRQDARVTTLFFVIVCALTGHDSVDHVGKMKILGNDSVLVPIFVFDFRLNLFRITDRANFFDFEFAIHSSQFGFLASIGQDAAESFAIQNARIGFASFEVRLVTTDNPLLFFAFGSKLRY